MSFTNTEKEDKQQLNLKYRVFGMQVGCGVDCTTYAAAYAKNFKKQSIGCAVVLNNGTLPINLLMPL